MQDAGALSGTPLRWSEPSGELRDVGLRVRELGSGPATLLLLHGLAGSNRYFGGAFDVLADEARLLVPDLLGFGGSPRPWDLDYGAQAHARALEASLEQLNVRPPLYVGAHSAGALVALRLAHLRPDWVRGVVAFGPPFYRDSASALQQIRRLGFMVRIFAMNTPWARLACAWMCRHRAQAERIALWARPDLPAPIARDGAHHSWASYSGTVQNLILGNQPPEELDWVEVPLWLIAGHHDAVIDSEWLETISARYPNVSFERWSGGHDLPLADPPRCVRALRGLLGGVLDLSSGQTRERR